MKGSLSLYKILFVEGDGTEFRFCKYLKRKSDLLNDSKTRGQIVLVVRPAIDEEEAASAGEGNGLAVITVVVVTPFKFKYFCVLCTVLK